MSLVVELWQWRGWRSSLVTLTWAVVRNRVCNVVYLWAQMHWQRGGKREIVIAILGTYAVIPTTLPSPMPLIIISHNA